jgi:hypothetical protein
MDVSDSFTVNFFIQSKKMKKFLVKNTWGDDFILRIEWDWLWNFSQNYFLKVTKSESKIIVRNTND